MRPARHLARAALAASLLAIGCGRPEPPVRCAHDTSAWRGSADVYRYRVSAGPDAEQLCVSVDIPASPDATAGARWGVAEALAPYLRDVDFSPDGRSWKSAQHRAGAWLTPGCVDRPCRLRYRVLLRRAAGDLADTDAAREHRGVLVSPASSWMLHPLALAPDAAAGPPPRSGVAAHGRAPAGDAGHGRAATGTIAPAAEHAAPVSPLVDPERPRAPYLLYVSTPAGLGFTSGVALDTSDPRLFRGDIGDLDDAPWAAFGRLSLTRLAVPGGAIDVAFSPGKPALPTATIAKWIETSARAVASYFGAFPIDHASIIVLFEGDRAVGNGRTMGNGGASILLTLGERATREDLADDWILVHEMVHVSFPNVLRPWAEEGLATYLEPIIRARAGLLSADEVWRSMIEGLPQGLPERGDQGLDHTDTWGRRYWGGALFWFLADLEIRQKSQNRRSLDDALRGIARKGGNVAVTWDLDRTLAEGDASAGVPVLVPLRRRLGKAPERVDLDALWKRLGVSIAHGRVVYDESAPLAAARRGITGG